MKKILSLTLAALMVVSMVPTAFAADVNYDIGTQISVEGSATSEYEIKVPARLEAGGASGNVIATGTWRSSETLIVTAADEVEVTNEETGLTTMVPVVFDDINASGNDLAAMSVSKAISVEKGDVLFGTWTGIVEYNVEFLQLLTATYNGQSFSFKDGMSWNDLIDSEYNTLGFKLSGGYVQAADGKLVADSSNTNVSPDARINQAAYITKT